MSEVIKIVYKLTFKNGVEKIIPIELEKKTLNLIQKSQEIAPYWTQMHYKRCPNCKMDDALYHNCPVAINIFELMHIFREIVSYDEVKVEVTTEERAYTKNTTVQQAVSSIVGIYMASSQCSIMSKLKPMLRYHLPFASLEETAYRAISMYFFSEYFKGQKTKQDIPDLGKLVKIYDEIQIVNKCFALRLSELNMKDAGISAIAILNSFANYVSFSINEEMLEEWKSYFEVYE